MSARAVVVAILACFACGLMTESVAAWTETGQAIAAYIVNEALDNPDPLDLSSPYVYVRDYPLSDGDHIVCGSAAAHTEHPVVAGQYLAWIDAHGGARFEHESVNEAANHGEGPNIVIYTSAHGCRDPGGGVTFREGKNGKAMLEAGREASQATVPQMDSSWRHRQMTRVTFKACCKPGTAECAILTREECEAQGGDWLEDIVECDPNPCPSAAEEVTWGVIKALFR